MKLIRFGEAGQEKPGVLINDKRIDVSSIVTDYNEAFLKMVVLQNYKKP